METRRIPLIRNFLEIDFTEFINLTKTSRKKGRDPDHRNSGLAVGPPPE
jgi:hypothetical protein